VTAYARLEDRFRSLGALKEAAGVLHWDMATMMPKGGADARGEQLAALNVACHELIAAPDLAELLEDAEGEQLGTWQQVVAINHDNRSRARTIEVSITGTTG